MKRKSLNNPPIKEVIIGIAFNGLFSSFEEIDDFCDKISKKNNFIDKEQIKSVTFQINEEPKISQGVSSGIMLSTANKEEFIQIELNKIVFIDRTKYTDFESFFGKFKIIIEDILSNFNNNIEILDIGLRYLNNFNLPIINFNDYFKILPTIACNENNIDFANLNNYLVVANIISPLDTTLQATAKTIFNLVGPNTINITFDIDTHFVTPYSLSTIEDFQNKILKLKEFKNQIFFSNFVDAYSIEEFK